MKAINRKPVDTDKRFLEMSYKERMRYLYYLKANGMWDGDEMRYRGFFNSFEKIRDAK